MLIVSRIIAWGLTRVVEKSQIHLRTYVDRAIDSCIVE